MWLTRDIPLSMVGSERIENTKKLHPDMCFICENADRLPYPDEFFDIVIQATVFTSILEPKVKKGVALRGALR